MKKQTFRFYTDSGFYKGWLYLNYYNYHTEILQWLKSGNIIMIKLDYDRKITWNNRTIFHLNSYLSKLIKG